MWLAIKEAISVNPLASVVIMTDGQEYSIGKSAYDKMMAEGLSYDDPELQAYVDRIGQRLVANSDEPGSLQQLSGADLSLKAHW